jgi:hypothetical protein
MNKTIMLSARASCSFYCRSGILDTLFNNCFLNPHVILIKEKAFNTYFQLQRHMFNSPLKLKVFMAKRYESQRSRSLSDKQIFLNTQQGYRLRQV